MEAIDQNTEYEQQAAGGEVQGIGRQVSEVSENEYDGMNEDQADKLEDNYDSMYN